MYDEDGREAEPIGKAVLNLKGMTIGSTKDQWVALSCGGEVRLTVTLKKENFGNCKH